MKFLPKFRDRHRTRAARARARPALEALEGRLLLYSASGNAWPAPQLVTISFEPDGTNLNGHVSNLQSTFNSKFGSASAWQNIILQAAQSWAQQTNLNFAVVADNGSATGSGTDQQGDPSVGDIRIGGYNFGDSTLAQTYMPPPVNNYSIAGDVVINTGQSFTVNSSTNYDLQTVLTHEIGHALGLYHSGTATSEEYGSYNGKKSALTSDDIAGIQSIYGGPRKADAYQGGGGNGSSSQAYDVTKLINVGTLTAVVPNASLAYPTQNEWYVFTAPAGGTGNISVNVQSSGLSLLTPSATLYDSTGRGTLATAAAAIGQSGTTLTLSSGGIVAGQQYYVKVTGVNRTQMSTGAYGLALNFGTGVTPTVPSPTTTKANGSPLAGGGGQAIVVNTETLVNTYTISSQTLSANNRHAVGMDRNGNYVVAFADAIQDGSGYGVYAQRYDVNGVKVGGEFLVNTTTSGNQANPTVAVAPNGNFLVAWQSLGQDAAGSQGIYAQMYKNDGTRIGGETLVNTTTAGDQQFPVASATSNGNYLVTWTTTSSPASVSSQMFKGDGTRIGGETLVASGSVSGASVALSDNVSVVTWADAALGIMAREFNNQDVPLGPAFQVSTYAGGKQSLPNVAMDSKGNFAITWTSNGQDGNGLGVFARRFNAAASPTTAEFQVNTSTTKDQTASSPALDDAGDLLIVWSSNGTANSHMAVFMQQYAPTNLAVGGELQVNTSNGYDQQYPSAVVDNIGHAAVVWSGGGAADTTGVYMQQFNISQSGLEGVTFDSFDAAGTDPMAGHPAHGQPAHATHGHRFGHRPLAHWNHGHGKANSAHVARPAHRSATPAHPRHR